MPFNEKVNLEQYFKDEIERVSSCEISAVEKEIEDIRSNAIKDIEAEAQQEAGMVEEQELRELSSEFAVKMSQLHEATDRRLMQKRDELTADIFRACEEQVIAFAAGKDYPECLRKQAAELGRQPHEGACLYVREADLQHAQIIREAFAQPCSVEQDKEIRCGGIRLECAQEGIVIDHTFDNALAEEKDWFFRNSGLFIK